MPEKSNTNANNIETIKLAITISGAVSLGSFEGGALYELLHTIAKYNQNSEADNRPQIKIDVFTGASAGGMTAAIAAQHLLYDGLSFRNPLDNPLYNAWVRDVDLKKLSELSAKDNPGLSIFSSNAIHKIAKDHLGQDFSRATATDAHPAAAESIRVGLALSNLTGVDYAVNVWGGNVSPQKSAGQVDKKSLSLTKADVLINPTGQFVYTKYADQQRQTFKQGAYDAPLWREFTRFVISCGAFPFAFRPVDISVQNEHYSQQGAKKERQGSETYLFTDGGVFQNEPIGLAKAIVNEIDADHLHGHNRFYIYIAPSMKGSSVDNKPLLLQDMDAVNVARTLAKAVFNQSKFQDWISTEAVNKQLAVFDRRVQRFKEDLIGKKVDLSETDLLKVANPLLELLFNKEEADIEKQLTRLRVQYAHELVDFGANQELAEAWLKSVLVFETAAELGDKDEMKIFGVTADESELASGRLFAFTGFFARKLREHDYAVGRKKAREVMRTVEQIRAYVDTNDNELGIDSTLANYDVMNPDSDPALRKKLDAAYDRGTNYLMHSFLKNWMSIKQVVLNAVQASAKWTLIIAVISTLLVFALGVVLGAAIN